MDDPNNNVNAIRDLAIAAAGLSMVGNTPCAVVPEGYRVEKLEYLLQTPLRKTGVVVFNDLPSFAWYVNEHVIPGSVVYLSREKEPLFTAVLDEHGKDSPGWRQHRTQIKLVHSRQFTAWSILATRDQKAFAEFLEDRVNEVATPDGASLFELVTNLEASQNASFSSYTKLSNGDARLVYNKETKAGNGTMEVPQRLTLFIPIWENSERTEVNVKLRFFLREGTVSFKLEIERLEDLVDAAIDNAIDFIREKTKVPVLRGKIVA